MWWEQYGDSAPGLQHVAIRVLSQVCSASVFDRSWSSSQQIHPEKRNKLDKETFNDLLYVHYNLKLQARGKPTEADPIVLEDMDMTSDWVEETEAASTAQWLDRFSSLDGGDLNTRQFNSSIFASNDHLFNL
ncbi:unnamed protein product [Spirodela intermedia]|nr:unnamed protein product [Spirodela intermedia]CAA6665905.1 unnamed protein product [Spirodela intermedia]